MKTIDIRKIERDKHILRETKVSIGDKLQNCAILLAESEPIRFSSEVITTVVLAVCGGFTPFVVWDRCRDKGDHGPIVDYCVNGSYFRHLTDALTRYDELVAREQKKVSDRGTSTIAEQYREWQTFQKEAAAR